ncbi:MAG: hypothetical protein WEE64_01795 [Dehalococcoidia bacterium]
MTTDQDLLARRGLDAIRADHFRHPNGRRVRVDALPEYLAFRDAGCDLSPTCLRCPLEHCRYDEPGGARKLLQGSRDGAVCQRRAEGAAIDVVASEFGLSRRSVFRILAAGREEKGTLRRSA